MDNVPGTVNAYLLNPTITTPTLNGVPSVSSDGMKFQNTTASYTPTALNYYEEVTMTNNCVGPFASAAMDYKITRLGNRVSVYLPGIRKAGNSTLSSIALSGKVPARFLPTGGTGVTLFAKPTDVIDAGAGATGMIQMTLSDGTLKVYKDATGAGFQSTTSTVGFDACSLEWLV